ncbi:MAG: hypothetical protein NVSMB57_07400 [Actinomycetota bacterium]
MTDAIVHQPELPEQPARHRRARRWPVGLVVLLLLTGGIVLDRVSPARAPHVAAIDPVAPGGLLACPFLFSGNGRSWMHFANSGNVASKITWTTVREKAPPIFKTFSLDAGRAVTMPLDPSVHEPAGAIVDYAGGEVVASRTSVFNAGAARHGGIGAPCTRAGERVLIVPNGATLNSETSVILLNPGTSDALADVSLGSDGQQSAPEGLKNIVVPARGRSTIRVGDFAFDQKAVAAIVTVRTGLLAADGIVASANGISLTPAVAPGTEFAGVAPADGGSMITDVVAYGENDAVTDASLMTREGSTAFANLPQDLAPFTPSAVSPSETKSATLGVDLSLRDGSDFAASLRWVVRLSNGRSDVGSAMMIEPAPRLVAVTGDPVGGAQSRILIGNPSEAPATVHITLITAAGRGTGAFQDPTLEPGSVVSIPAGSVKGPFAVLAESTQPIVMTIASSVVGKDVVAFGISGLPRDTADPVVIEQDSRLGVPAPARAH